jgi:hypothetical protein
MRKSQFTDLRTRLERHYECEPFSGCWLFTGKLDKDGYGSLRNRTGKGGDFKSHRVAWEVYVGPITQGLSVAHHCDVRSCVNPSHLYLATHRKNIADRSKRKREPRGELCSWAKITRHDVDALRNSNESPSVWAQRLGISRSQAYRIKNSECWK